MHAGGLAVIATSRYPSRRHDAQLRGRSGRQGDPGFSHTFLSFDDDLIQFHATDRMLPRTRREQDHACPHWKLGRLTCAQARRTCLAGYRARRMNGHGKPVEHGTSRGALDRCTDESLCPGGSDGITRMEARRRNRLNAARRKGVRPRVESVADAELPGPLVTPGKMVTSAYRARGAVRSRNRSSADGRRGRGHRKTPDESPPEDAPIAAADVRATARYKHDKGFRPPGHRMT